jgi:hypothetical protein
MLEGKPASESATSSVLEDLSNSYYNALVGANERSGAMGKDGTLLNLVPVSANIFAGAFARNNHGSLHLDPSYTLTAIMVAVGEMLKSNLTVGELALYYFSPELYQDAVNLVEGLKTRKS